MSKELIERLRADRFEFNGDLDLEAADLIEAQQKRIYEAELVAASLQAKIDALMLEFCPEEMTKEQIDNWMNHQVKSPFDIAVEKQEAAFDAAMEKVK